MKHLLCVLAIIAIAGMAIAENAFSDFGDCEDAVFHIPSARGSWQTMEDAQFTTPGGVVGNCLFVNATTGRFEGSSNPADTTWPAGTGAEMSFYYKMPTFAYSYPRLAVRQDPVSPITNGEVGDCAAYIEWTNTSFTADTSWHLFEPDISSLDWDTVAAADFYVNNYAVPEWYLDEIELTPLFLNAADPHNVFSAWGDCEDAIFHIPSARGNWPTMEDAQFTTPGVVGNAVFINATTGRFEGSSYPTSIMWPAGTEATLSFYYKIPTMMYSYPRLALRQDPVSPITNGEVGDCAAYLEWTNTSFTIDDSWHIFEPDLSSLTWDGVTATDFFVNNYAVPEWNLDEIVLIPSDASDDPDNAFASFGDCEGAIFVEPSARGNWQTMEDAQFTTPGVVGMACMVAAPTGRFEGSSADQPVAMTGTDPYITFYYKMPTLAYSYPRLAVRQDPNTPGTNGEVGDSAAYVEWTNTSFTVDGSWHLFEPDISALNWDGVTLADFYCNNYAVPEFHLDEIYLVDPTPFTRVEDWGLF
jgi:hypothetical protein